MAAPKKELDFSGELQNAVMAAVWELGEAKVDDVRNLLPKRRRPAYNTVQTVMNRLVERGLLERRRERNAYAYRATIDEAEYLARTINTRLAGASPGARRAVLVSLVGELGSDDLDELARYANRIRRARDKGGS